MKPIVFGLIATGLIAARLLAQSPAALSPKESEQLATHMVQLIESTAVSIPGLVRAGEPVKQNAEMTAISMQRTPLNPALTYLFINQVKAYLALSDSIPRPYPFPETAERQYAELREDLQRLQQHFEAILQVGTTGTDPREADPADLKHYAAANTKLLPPGKLPRVVFLGDSITELWRLNEYFTGRDFLNRGISGQTSLQILARFNPDVVALSPRAVVILAGTNDLAHGVRIDAIENDLSMLGDLAKAHGIKALFGSILPVSDYHKDADPGFEMTKSHPTAAIRQINQWLQEHCRAEGFTYVDYYSAMVDGAGQMQADLSDDGLHPNAKGYRVMSPIALEAVGRVLSGADQLPDPAQPKRRFRIMTR